MFMRWRSLKNLTVGSELGQKWVGRLEPVDRGVADRGELPHCGGRATRAEKKGDRERMIKYPSWISVRSVAASLAVTGLLLAPTMPASAAGKAKVEPTVPHFNHVFVIVMENHSYNDLMYENDVPYLHQLARQYGLATQYYGVTNPSVGDRVALLSGMTAGTELPGHPTTGLTQPNLIDQLSAHGISWGAFYEHSRLSTAQNPIYNYQHGHSTFLRFKDIANNSTRMSHLQPLRQLGADLSQNRLPHFVWVSPNSVGNMEGGYRSPGQFSFQGAGPGGAGTVDSQLEQGGNQFLKTWIPQIMHSKAWHQGSNAIFIAFDETSYDASIPTDGYWLSHTGAAGSPVVPQGTNLSGNSQFLFPGGVDGGGHTLALVITNKPHHVVSATPYNEYSILKTVEAGWHLGYLGHAAQSGVHTMRAFFGPSTRPYGQHKTTVGSLAGYSARLASTPVIAKTAPTATSSLSTATLMATTNPYLAEGQSHQVASTVSVQENQSGVLTQSLTLTLPAGRGVTFAEHSSPVASTKVSNPSDHATQFAPSTVSAHSVTIPVVTASAVPSDAIITGLTLNTAANATAGSVVATVSSGGQGLGTVTLGSVGKPARNGSPQMMAPVVFDHQVAWPFVPAQGSLGHHLVRLRIEGQYPTAAGQDANQYASLMTRTNAPEVTDSAVRLTSQAGKQYWVEAKTVGTHHSVWSSPITFSVVR